MIPEEALNKLNKTPFFEGVTFNEEELVYKKLKRNQIANEIISGKEYVGVIISGKVDVYSVSVDGTEIKLTSLSEGDIYGICNLYCDCDRETVLMCRSVCEMIYIRKNIFKDMLADNPLIMERYLSLCNKKINFLLKRTEILTMQSCRAKVINHLISQVSDGCVRLSESKESLAKSLGISRAALYRELSDLKREELITVSNNSIRIMDTDALEQKLYDQ